MNKFYAAISTFLLLCFACETYGQQKLVTDSKKNELIAFSAKINALYIASHQKALQLAKSNGWPLLRKTKNGGLISLQGINSIGYPRYLITYDNIIAAATTQTNVVQPGGSSGLNLSGSSTALNGKLAIWDGGSVYIFHQEFAGKTITVHDAVPVLDHATHVSGTMIAKGVYPPAKGMAFNANTLQSYYFNNDVAEMSAAAPNLLLSNHSYGDEAGWNFDDVYNRWEWLGLPGDTVDYQFGFYSDRTKDFDNIAYNAPYYLIVESAGNSRGSTGPAVGDDYYGFKSSSNQTFVDKGPRPAGISDNAGYDIISTTGNAKNILTVGAVNPLPNGPASSKDITISYFSGWGPTDDGRVKPDIVGDGVNVLSTGVTGPSAYLTLSGTSMAAPNVTGSLYLLQEYYSQKNNGNFMHASTLKGLACHTAFDAGNIGPDYIYGWGLLDMNKATQAITDNGTKSLLAEKVLQQGQQQTTNVTASGNGPLVATISWTDPPGSPTMDGVVNDPTPKLINDLDIRISDGTNTFKPWVLNPAHPSATATTGDNIVDNIEQVYIPGATPGKAYTITVSHKGQLLSGVQDYSLIVTGIGGQAYCTSGPLSNADSRIENLALSNINYTQTTSCTSYTNLTNQTVQLEQGKTYPLSITLSTCGANLSKAAKVFIDWNGNGVFDPGELVTTTGVFSATGTYNTTITVPASVVPGNYSLMRVVLTETIDPSIITPCGTYAKGETQDYRVQFLKTSIDAGVVAIVNPDTAGACAALTQVTVSLKNFGAAAISGIPVTVTVTSANQTITTFNQTYAGTLQPLEQENFTLNGTFNAKAGATYSITASTNFVNDAVTANNQATSTVVIGLPPAIVSLNGYYCVDSKQYQLSGMADGELLWYQNIGDAIPLTYGSPAFTATAPVNNTYYAGLNDFTGSIGPVTKNVFSGGGYNQFTPEINVYTGIPIVIESARLYIGNSGKITFNVTDANGQIVSTTTIDAVATRSNPQAGAQTDDPNDQGAVYNLNLMLPAKGTYSISTVYDSTATIYRNNAGVSGYPFTIGNIFSITGNTASSGSDTTFYRSFYYYLYDIKLKSAGCAATVRQPVTIVKPIVTQTGNILNSNFPSGNQWLLNGKPIAGATGATYSPLQSGNYTVEDTLSSGCVAQSDNFFYAMLVSSPGTNTDIGLTIFPVPASGPLNIVFVAKADDNMTLSLINAVGKIVYNKQQAVTAGNFSTAISVANLPPGGYVVKLLLGKKEYKAKIIIDR